MESAKDSESASPGESVFTPDPVTKELHSIISDTSSEIHGVPIVHSPGTQELVYFKDDGSELKTKSGNLTVDINLCKLAIGSAEVASPGSAGSSSRLKKVTGKGLIDNSVPFESVKEAVSKFGGIVDWKAHKAMTMERQKNVEVELKKAQEEIPEYKKQSEAAEEAKEQVLKELEDTKRLIEELKLSLEKAQTEEAQAKQDSELAQLRAKEVEQGITDDASVAAKTQLEVAKARHEAAVADLRSVKQELEALKGDYDRLVSDRDCAIQKAKETVSASKEIEKLVEDLTLELITAKESLGLAHASHLEAEESKITAAVARDQTTQNLEMELKQVEVELQELNEQLMLSKDLKSKLDEATTLLLNVKAELAAYMEAKLQQEKLLDEAEGANNPVEAELEQVKLNIEKAKDEVNCLRVAASSLKAELEKEQEALASVKQREEGASLAVSSLEVELSKTKAELELALTKQKETEDKIEELPKLIQQASQEAEKAKLLALSARQELNNAREEAELAKASAGAIEIRLHAAMKEVEAANASERLAIAAVKALEESQNADKDSPHGVTLPLEEYYNLSKRAHEAEELAKKKVETAIEQIKQAKDSENQSLQRLEEVKKELDDRKEALKSAVEAAEKAQEGKLAVEQELRIWRAEHEQRRKAGDAALIMATSSEKGEAKSSVDEEGSVAPNLKVCMEENTVPEQKARKKKSFFPRIVMFLARKKAQSLK